MIKHKKFSAITGQVSDFPSFFNRKFQTVENIRNGDADSKPKPTDHVYTSRCDINLNEVCDNLL